MMKKLIHNLSTASCALLGISSPVLANDDPWLIDVGAMTFIEEDRNTGLEFIIQGSKETDDGGAITLKTELDVITGATPNGATSSNQAQVFTMSSGIGEYGVAANELPADDTHMDTRMSFEAAIKKPISDTVTTDYNALISMEFDYLAFAAGGNIFWDLNKNNTTIVSGVNFEYNRVHPVGGIPIPFESMQPGGAQQPRSIAAESKIGEEFSIGINQIIDRTSLAQIRFTTSHFTGYLNDGYKLLSVVDDQNIATLGQTLDYVFENRPSSRTMKSVYLAYKKSLPIGILDVSYRYYDDSWEIQSNTIDLAFKYKMDNHYFIKPNIRRYQQNAAYFYRHSLNSSESLPSFASSDFRLAQYDATTLGVEFGKDLANGRKESFSIEYYTQEGNSHPDSAVGIQQQQDLYPTLKTWIFKYVYAFKF